MQLSAESCVLNIVNAPISLREVIDLQSFQDGEEIIRDGDLTKLSTNAIHAIVTHF